MSELIRSFVAIKVPGSVADELENFLAELRPLANIRWVRREQFHITLKFLGEIERETLEQVKTSLEPLKFFDPFTIELSYIGAFPNLNTPRVIWLAGDKGAKELGQLARKVNDVLHDEAEIERDDKKFKAHLTLARLKNSYLSEELIRKLGTIKNFSWECSELVLMRSFLKPSGPVYTQLL
ncbi:MAG: RNA 2',3'-cyclic phosphodiesterase [Synergistaceae bacterium]|nr:RNA 2',3'-cyclic phosphodiesterase [Synergistaceae bacterium]